MASVEKKPLVPETQLKKKKSRQELLQKRVKTAALLKKKRHEKKLEIFKRVEMYAREYSVKERDEIRTARQARQHGNFCVPPAPKLAFVMRIRGINRLHPI